MTEAQFWASNPKIIAVWEEAYKLKTKTMNNLIHAWVGNYGISALAYTIDHCFNKTAKSKYVEKPMQIFELTPEEKEAAREKELKKFMLWAGATERKYKKEGEKDG